MSGTRNISATNLTDGQNTVSYSSRMISRYIKWLEKQVSPEILDIGPVCDVTINFFLPRVKRIHINDMFQWLHKNGSSESLTQELNYQPHSFDAVHLWDCVDHIQDSEAPVLVQAVHSILKPGGSLLITANEEFFQLWPLNSFAVMEACQVVLRPQPHIDLPFSHWKNRDIIHLMKLFTLKDSFVYTCGIREFLFRRI